jgi:signal transduction histidine kinase
VAAILASVERLGEQIENVLDLSQSEAGTLPLARDPVEIFPADRRRQGTLGPDFRRGPVARLARQCLGRHGDGRRAAAGAGFGQLVDNAIAATPEGGRILIECTRQRQGARGDLGQRRRHGAGGAGARDGGLKVTPDGRAAERRQGLGLPLVRQLVEAHGGTIELLSEPGQGTAAIVDLP